mmetsp:Transcript_37009/g.56749  ORF Transcript_37009/g.56749 Transcript_37009/m.56749 type:complete len:121 (+) Transcript_37009:327-689(+)
MATKCQVPDSFPYIIERDFSDTVAVEFEEYVAQCQQASRYFADIEGLDMFQNFQVGVKHMNQVVSFDRLVYFGFIQQEHKDPRLLNHEAVKERKSPVKIAFNRRISPKDDQRMTSNQFTG